MKKKRVLFISSTGGHFNELQQLQPLFEKYDYHIITEKDKSTEKLTEKYGDKIMYLPCRIPPMTHRDEEVAL